MESLSANGRRDRSSTDIVIIGGGVVGVLAAMRMRERDVEYRIIERHSDLGGTWHTHSNNYSTAQAPAAGYQLHPAFPLGKQGPFEQISGNVVLTRLRELAAALDIDKHTECCSDVETIQQRGEEYVLVIRDVNTGAVRQLQARNILVCHGIMGRPYLPEERGLHISKSFAGTVTLGCRMDGKDSAVGSRDINGRDVVIIGTGAFGCEAMRAAVRNGAASVTVVTRKRTRWIVPYSRQYMNLSLLSMPLLPWAWKAALFRAWLTHCYYRPCGLAHLAPRGLPRDMDFTGQSHNEYFQFARTGQVRHVVGPATAVDEAGVRLADGSVLPADMVVYCGGFEFQGSPPFLAELGLGYEDLHSYAFLGTSGRIGTASDVTVRYVPIGPAQQIDMFLRAHALSSAGRIAELRAALEPTPIDSLDARGFRSERHTMFEASQRHSAFPTLVEARNRAHEKVLGAGRSRWGKLWLSCRLAWLDLVAWLLMCTMAIREKLGTWRVY